MSLESIIKALGIVCGAIIVVGGASAILVKVVASFLNTDKRISSLEKCRKDNDDAIQLILEAMTALMDNAVTGNSIEKIKAARDKMQAYLIARD
jgi:methionine synthase I (cobalamin-dependent)